MTYIQPPDGTVTLQDISAEIYCRNVRPCPEVASGGGLQDAEESVGVHISAGTAHARGVELNAAPLRALVCWQVRGRNAAGLARCRSPQNA